nr:hypothetical protein [Methylobacillus glycogenes]
MSSLRWLSAGATASYGTVSEPCNYWQKFPNSAVLLKYYLMGASAIEATGKASPGQYKACLSASLWLHLIDVSAACELVVRKLACMR